MSASLTKEETEIAERLVNAGFARPAAALAVVMVTREHSRPESELVDIVRQYQWLDSPVEAHDAISDLKRRGWLKEQGMYGITILRQHEHLRKKIADELNDTSVRDALTKLRSAVDPYVKNLGSMNEGEVYSSYLDLLRSAQSEICLPMLATSPNLKSVDILKERAEKGVRVRILLAAPRLVGQLRGEVMQTTAKDAIQGWSAHAKGLPQMELRIMHVLPDTYIATCMLIDGTLLRFDVYDPHKQRSLQGIMIEFHSPNGLDLNITRMFRSHFDEAWRRARPIGTFKAGLWYLKFFWNFAVGGVFWIVAAVTAGTIGSQICISVSAGFLVNGLIEFRASIINTLKGWLRS